MSVAARNFRPVDLDACFARLSRGHASRTVDPRRPRVLVYPDDLDRLERDLAGFGMRLDGGDPPGIVRECGYPSGLCPETPLGVEVWRYADGFAIGTRAELEAAIGWGPHRAVDRGALR